MFITLNGEPHELTQPLTRAELLATLAIDPRRVAVEHNLEIIGATRLPTRPFVRPTGSK